MSGAALPAYAESFLRAWTSGDQAGIEQLASAALREQLATFPTLTDTGTRYRLGGFSSYLGEPPSIHVSMPEGQMAVSWMVALDADLAGQGLDHWTTGFGFSGDKRWV